MVETATRVVIVTGAAQGQGAAEARAFLATGATVIAADIAGARDADADDGDGDGDGDRDDAGGRLVTVAHDVTDPASWQRLVELVGDRFGRLDALVNNAGISRGLDVRGTTLDEWNAVLAVDLTGAFLGIQSCTPLLIASGGGAIVNTGTAAAFNGFYRAAYSAAKWGLRGLTKSAALELAPFGITVNAIHPGLVDSPMATESPLYEGIRAAVPIGRATSTDEIADLVVFLTSPTARSITGADLLIDGGLTAAGAMNHLATTMGLWS